MGGTRLRPVTEGGHIIEDEGTPLPDQPALNFVGDGVVAADIAGKSTVTIPGGSGGGPQSINPIDIAVGLKHEWLYDGFFYTSLAILLDHSYEELGTGTLVFTSGNGKLSMTTTNLNGGKEVLVTRRAWKIPNPLLKDDIFWRALVEVQNNAGGAVRFAYVGLVQNPVSAIIFSAALDDMGDSVAFISSEAQNGNNWTCMTQIGTTRTLTNTSVNIRNVIKKLECRSIVNGDIEFLIDGVVVATHSTNIPEGANIIFRCGISNLTNDANILDLFGITVASSEVV